MDDILLSYTPDNSEFHVLLCSEIERIWNSNPERLLAILYRIDISESLVKQAFSMGICPEAIDFLAVSIENRMEQKRLIRLRYQ